MAAMVSKVARVATDMETPSVWFFRLGEGVSGIGNVGLIVFGLHLRVICGARPILNYRGSSELRTGVGIVEHGLNHVGLRSF